MQIPDVRSVEALPGPFEILELGDRGRKELVINNYVLGRMTIHPRPIGTPKEIVALRVFVPDRIKPLYPDYYDITSQTLIAQLLSHLGIRSYEQKLFTITKHGTGPSARFSLEVR